MFLVNINSFHPKQLDITLLLLLLQIYKYLVAIDLTHKMIKYCTLIYVLHAPSLQREHLTKYLHYCRHLLQAMCLKGADIHYRQDKKNSCISELR